MKKTGDSAYVLMALVSLALGGLAATAAQASERFRTFWRGQIVEYVEIGDYAVTEGDIILGHKDEVRAWREAFERGQAQMAETLKALSVDAAGRLWNIRVGGVVQIPYTIEAGNSTNINDAIAEVNRLLEGLVRWVPRTNENDYVAFNLTAANSGACASFVGRRGGRQEITGDPECSVSGLVHEMGHAMGLWHVQQDARAGAFVDLRLASMDPAYRSNNQPIFGTRTYGGHDYASIMHYSRTSFAKSGRDRITLETKPAGIDVRGSGLSPADIDTLRRLYGGTPTRTTVTSNPPGLRVIVDGVAVTTPATFDWPIGSVHRLWVEPGFQQKDGFTFAFGRWSHDPSSNPSRQLTWEVRAGDGSLGAPATAPADTVITANFVRLIDVQTTPATQAGGTSRVAPRVAPWPGTTTLYPQFSYFDLSAEPNPGFEHFFSWNSAFNVGGAAINRSISLLLTPTVATQTVGAGFHPASGPSIRVHVAGPGAEEGVTVRNTPPGGTTGTTFAPRLARTTPGQWRIEMPSPQLIGASIRNIREAYEGYDDPANAVVTMPTSGVREVTIRMRREVRPYRQVIPSCAGTITLSNTSEWLTTGTPLTVTLTPNGVGVFTGWQGTLSGTALSHNITVGTDVPEFTAVFNSTSEPLEVREVFPSVIGDEATPREVTIRGRGFTPSSQVWVAGIQAPMRFIDSGTLVATLDRRLSTASGRAPLNVRNALSSSCTVTSNSVALDVLPLGQRAVVTLTEYYHAGFDYYFLTGRDADKRLLDSRPEWRRTGSEIRLQAVGNEQTSPFERFFFPEVARNGLRGSHFYTALAEEQRLLAELNPTNQALRAKPVLEGIEAYAFPVRSDGTCPPQTIPVYRAFKGPPRYVDDGNHRFSTSLAQHRDMVDRLGWTDEGVRFCALP
ncbi:MAG: M12 family metallopeptidase [Burkholderiales bacterium]|nr:M12 family metallopeptidase [Burkholderiales bacterium]